MTDDIDNRLNPYAPPREVADAEPLPVDPLAQPIVAQGQYTWAQAERFFYMLSGMSRATNWQAVVIIGMAVLSGAIVSWVIGSWIAALCLAAGIVFFTVRDGRQRKAIVARAHAWLDGWENATVTNTITSESIVLQAHELEIATMWTDISSYQRDREVDMLLLFSAHAVLLFPREHFANDADWNRFQKAIAVKVLKMNVL